MVFRDHQMYLHIDTIYLKKLLKNLGMKINGIKLRMKYLKYENGNIQILMSTSGKKPEQMLLSCNLFKSSKEDKGRILPVLWEKAVYFFYM